MANTVTLLPFLRQGTNSMLYAYFANFAPGQQLTLTTKILQKVGVHTGVHLSSVRRYIQKQPQNRYFIIKKEGLFFTVIRSDLVLNGQKVAININKPGKPNAILGPNFSNKIGVSSVAINAPRLIDK